MKEQIKNNVAFHYGYINWDNFVKSLNLENGYKEIEFNKIMDEVINEYGDYVEDYCSTEDDYDEY